MDDVEGGTLVYAYLLTVVGLSGLVLGLLSLFYSSGHVADLQGLLASPVATAQGNARGLLVLAGILAVTVLLVAVVVGFGAAYGRRSPNEYEKN